MYTTKQLLVRPKSSGDVVARVSELAQEGQRLIVTGCNNDSSSSSYRNVQAIVRRVTDQVLVI